MDFIKMDADGVVIANHPDIKKNLENGYLQIHKDINLKPNSPDGQIIEIHSLAIYDLSLNVLNIINGFRISTAVGVQLDDIAQFVNQKRIVYPSSIIIKIKSIRQLTLDNDYTYEFENRMFSLEKGTVLKNGEHEYTLYETKNPATGKKLSFLIPNEAVKVLTPVIDQIQESDNDFRKRIINSRNYVNSATPEGLERLLLNNPNVNDAKIYDNPEDNTSTIGVPPKTLWIIVDTNDFEGIAKLIYDNIGINVLMKGNIEVIVKTKYSPKKIYFDLVKYVPIHIEIGIISAIQETASLSTLNELKTGLVKSLRFKIGIDLALSEVLEVLNELNKTFRYTSIVLSVYEEGKKTKARIKADERYVLYSENISFQVQGSE